MTKHDRKLKQFPPFRSDKEAEEFVANADLSEYDFSQFKPAHFEFERKSSRVNMRFPDALLKRVKEQATERGIPYQRLIREAVEEKVSRRK
jgi:predicted DNA binding CopG/RHH family protein